MPQKVIYKTCLRFVNCTHALCRIHKWLDLQWSRMLFVKSNRHLGTSQPFSPKTWVRDHLGAIGASECQNTCPIECPENVGIHSRNFQNIVPKICKESYEYMECRKERQNTCQSECQNKSQKGCLDYCKDTAKRIRNLVDKRLRSSPEWREFMPRFLRQTKGLLAIFRLIQTFAEYILTKDSMLFTACSSVCACLEASLIPMHDMPPLPEPVNNPNFASNLVYRSGTQSHPLMCLFDSANARARINTGRNKLAQRLFLSKSCRGCMHSANINGAASCWRFLVSKNQV